MQNTDIKELNRLLAIVSENDDTIIRLEKQNDALREAAKCYRNASECGAEDEALAKDWRRSGFQAVVTASRLAVPPAR